MLDSDTASYVMKKKVPAVLKRLEGVPVGDVCISAISHSELAFGAEASPQPQRDRERLDLLLRHVSVLDYPRDAAAHYAEIRAFLKKRGMIIGANDLLIAAHARCEGLVLVTNNTREFGRVPGLQIENWC
ncbi:MAG TPA: type II toxin-antitoxin system VapC family toxin [Terracidiphilus sp.]|nr:type II toxin-antitoxin system VapC family toxin [Terracidiphilus sp.]